MNSQFNTLANIDPCLATTWRDKVFLTFDIDWAHDLVILDSLELLTKADASATFFVTHRSDLIAELQSNQRIELGIHPNFNWLLSSEQNTGKDSRDVVDLLLEVIPCARSVRSHSLTQNSHLLKYFASVGLTHEANTFIPYSTGQVIRPWRGIEGLARIPYGWEDDAHILYAAQNIQYSEPCDIVDNKTIPLKVFDFHPIHVFLNTESLDRYERTRPLHQNPNELIRHRYQGFGTRNRLIELLRHTTKV